MNEIFGGYYRTDEEEQFPWSSTERSVWYAMIFPDMSFRGFTSSKTNKKLLLQILKEKKIGEKFLLIGVWTGNYSTHLFILNPEKAVRYLKI